MSEFVDNVWSQFAIETQEHIEEIELNLVAAENSAATPELVGALFRAFHSIKGLANAMGMSSFARLAHRAEDILGVIREGDFPLNSDVISLLLAALEEIKVLRQHLVASHANEEANPLLMEHLAVTFSSIEQTATSHDTADSIPLPPLTELHEDPEMLRYFIELAREKIMAISSALEPFCAATSTVESRSAAPAVSEIDELAYAAEMMGFLKLVETLNDLRRVVPLQSQGEDGLNSALTAPLLELHDQLRHIESSSGTPDAGAHALHAILSDPMHVAVERLFATVVEQLYLLPSGNDADNRGIARTLHASFSALNSHLGFFMPRGNCSIILMFEDFFSRAASGELSIAGEIVEMTREEMHNIRRHYRNCITEERCLQENSTELALKLQSIQDFIWAYASGGEANNQVAVFRQLMAGLNIDPELVKILSPENARDLMKTLKQGVHIYEVRVHLESNEEMAARFLAWIETSGGRVITNRSLFIDGINWYEMLMVSPLHRKEIKQSLALFDPQGTSLHLNPLAGGVPENVAVVKTLGAVEQRRGAPSAAVSGNMIRVQEEALDSFMNLIGEMVLARSRLSHIIHDDRLNTVAASLKNQRSGGGPDSAELLGLIEEHRLELLESDQLLQNSLGRLQEGAVGLRVVPVEVVFKRLPRAVRDFARSQGKKIRLEMLGQDVKIDKAMVENITDPLLHMVRNSVDHGVEKPKVRAAAGKPDEAVIRVSAQQSGNRIVLEIYDDGAGIDTDRVLHKAIERGLTDKTAGASLSREDIHRFIFQPGFSTVDVVTETSGRGVGMDVVMTNVMRMGGTISVASEPGRGAMFTLRMPLSVAIQEVLMVEASGHTLALPGRYVSEIIEITADDLQGDDGEEGVLLRGTVLPLHGLAALLGYSAPAVGRSGRIAVVLTNGSRSVAFEVDKVARRQELFVKDVHESVAALPGVAGASILGNGRVVLILDGEDLLRMALSGSGR